jgi:hypothetical protein
MNFGPTQQLFPQGYVSTGKLTFADTLPTFGGGLTLFANRFFLDFSAQTMFNGSVTASNTIVGASPGTLTTVATNYKSDDMNRNEYALSLGYAFTQSSSIYAGYKWSRSYFNNVTGTGPAQIQVGNAFEQNAAFFTTADYAFKYNGPFVGATTGWQIETGGFQGRLALNAAVAFLQGDLQATSDVAYLSLGNGQPVDFGSPSQVFDTSGNSVGVLIGLSWLGQTSIKGLSYTAGVSGYKYDFSANNKGKADIGESLIQFKLGVAYAF